MNQFKPWILIAILTIVTIQVTFSDNININRSPNSKPDLFNIRPKTARLLEVNNLKPTSVSNMKHFVYFAFNAYCTETRHNWTCPYCKILGKNVEHDTEFFELDSGTLAYFAVDKLRKEIILAFRGADRLQNTLYALDTRLVPLSRNDSSGIRVHFGFLAALQTIYSPMVTRLRSLTLIYPKYKVILTGHSMGGTLAALTLFKLKRSALYQETRFELYTYGEVRCGNLAFAKAFNALDVPVARVVHGADIFPHIVALPSRGYVHHQNEVWEVSSTDIRNCNRRFYEDPECSNSLRSVFSFRDHHFYMGVDVHQFSCTAGEHKSPPF